MSAGMIMIIIILTIVMIKMLIGYNFIFFKMGAEGQRVKAKSRGNVGQGNIKPLQKTC